jgi:hypothetical protein
MLRNIEEKKPVLLHPILPAEALQKKLTEESWDAYQQRLNLSDDEVLGMQLLEAVRLKDNDQIEELLDELEVSPNFQAPERLSDFSHMAPLHAAKNAITVNYLWSRGAILNIQDVDGMTPLIYAIVEDKRAVAKELLKLGADINLTDNQGQTPEFLALNLEKPYILNLIIKARTERAITQPSVSTSLPEDKNIRSGGTSKDILSSLETVASINTNISNLSSNSGITPFSIEVPSVLVRENSSSSGNSSSSSSYQIHPVSHNPSSFMLNHSSQNEPDPHNKKKRRLCPIVDKEETLQSNSHNLKFCDS